MSEDNIKKVEKRKYVKTKENPVITGLASRSPKYTLKYGFISREEYKKLVKKRN